MTKAATGTDFRKDIGTEIKVLKRSNLKERTAKIRPSPTDKKRPKIIFQKVLYILSQ